MRAFVVDEFGKPGSIREVPDPEPRADQLLVKVSAAGVNPSDGAIVSGVFAQYGIEHRFPLIPGGDLSGQVAEAPEDTALASADDVYGAVGGAVFGEGSWAELVAVGVDDVVAKPSSLDHVAASGVATGGLTALNALEAAGLSEGAVLLLVGATGGVGSYATQLAALRGIHVIAVSRGENAPYARELGAAETIDYTQGDLLDLVRASHLEGVDALIDLVNDEQKVLELSELVRKEGAVVSARSAVNVEAVEAQGKRGVNARRAPLTRLPELSALLDDGRLKPPPTKTYPLERAQEALDEVGAGHVRGKLALTVA